MRWILICCAVGLVASSDGPAAVSGAAGVTFAQSEIGDEARLPSPTFPGVVALLADPPKALAALDRALAGRSDPAPVDALLLRAHLLSEMRRYGESVPIWDEAARRDGDVRQFANRSAIADLLAARDLDGATARVAAVVGPRPQRDDDLLLLSLADATLGGRQAAAAADIYRQVIARERGTVLADRARLGLASAQEAQNDLDGALETLHQATTSWRLPDTYASARSGERRLADRLHRQREPLTATQYTDVADRLTARSCFDDAIALLEEGVREHRLAADDEVEAAIVDNLYRGRRNDEAMARASAFLGKYPGSSLAPSIRLLQLRLDIRLGRVRDARARLQAMQADRTVPSSVRQSAMRTVAANLVSSDAPRDGLALYRQLLRSPLARADRFDLSWRAGIAAMRAGDDRSALDLLRQARKYAPRRSSPRSTLYWMAVVLDRSGQTPQATTLWRQIASENGYDYYGLQAAARLQAHRVATPPTTALPFPAVRPGDQAQASSEFRTGVALARAGLLDDAASMLAAAAARFHRDAGTALLAARAATAAGDYATAASLVSTHFGQFLARPSSGAPPDLWQMAFPRAYWTEVEGAAGRNAVDPLLLLSLMRRESRFVVTARSRSGAIGLFQIMPYTAREIVPVAEETRDDDALLNAPVSADLAARLVKRILSRFGGAAAPVVAAYNAGEDRVADWWRASNNAPEDVFVDTIPYGETRQYVREVLANYATYKRLYGGKNSQ